MESTIKRGAEVELEIESLAFGGRGVARASGLVVFVEDALPGQIVRARIIRKRKEYAEARIIAVLKDSPEAVSPRCPHFRDCGGCSFQHLEYSAQLKYKRQQVIESLRRIGGIENPPVEEILPSPSQFYYRNKMEFSFGDQRWLTREEIESPLPTKPKDFALGLHARGRFDKILDLDVCFLQSERSADIVNFVKQSVLRSGVPPYNTRNHFGYWRHLVIREGKNSGDLMVNLVTANVGEFHKNADDLARQLSKNFPEVTTIVHNINSRKAQVAIGDEERTLFGPGFIREKIGQRIFQISANSFFQTNSNGARLLYDKVLEFADFRSGETVYDLYAGAGTISLYIADLVREVIGFEIVADAVKDAERNCAINGVSNCRFIAGDLKDTLAAESEAVEKWGRPATVVIDPPRAGMHDDVLARVIELQPKKIVYVSCNPTTFARDVETFCSNNYELKTVQPVDMFPHTAHIEVVGLLRRGEV
jgi:23S rRNA (uracil1939-C5)-methyltransferase